MRCFFITNDSILGHVVTYAFDPIILMIYVYIYKDKTCKESCSSSVIYLNNNKNFVKKKKLR